jgi:uncharacterized membrane protein
MANVEEVTPTGPDTTRWRVKGPFGRTLEWEARTALKEPNSVIGWKTTEGEVGTAGQVRFRETAPGVTLVEVQMDYTDPLGGRVGEVASKVVAHPRLQLEQDLRNLKDILEGRKTPEEVQKRLAATTVQSGAAAFLIGSAGLLLLGASVLVILLLRHRHADRSERKRRLIFRS